MRNDVVHLLQDLVRYSEYKRNVRIPIIKMIIKFSHIFTNFVIVMIKKSKIVMLIMVVIMIIIIFMENTTKKIIKIIIMIVIIITIITVIKIMIIITIIIIMIITIIIMIIIILMIIIITIVKIVIMIIIIIDKIAMTNKLSVFDNQNTWSWHILIIMIWRSFKIIVIIFLQLSYNSNNHFSYHSNHSYTVAFITIVNFFCKEFISHRICVQIKYHE